MRKFMKMTIAAENAGIMQKSRCPAVRLLAVHAVSSPSLAGFIIMHHFEYIPWLTFEKRT